MRYLNPMNSILYKFFWPKEIILPIFGLLFDTVILATMWLSIPCLLYVLFMNSKYVEMLIIIHISFINYVLTLYLGGYINLYIYNISKKLFYYYGDKFTYNRSSFPY